MAPTTPHPDERIVASNRKARHDYRIVETVECGIVLTGDEVKSLRGGRASLTEAYARVRDGEVWLEGMHIPPYEQGDKRRHLPTRPRKLLLHRRQIDRLLGQQQEHGITLVPLRVYFTHGLAKVEIGLGRGKREHEVREALKKREHDREIERELGRRR
jgi:SsrA-binding protein